jgi:hypothetical protein
MIHLLEKLTGNTKKFKHQEETTTMSQSKLSSAQEAVVNVLIGSGVALASQLILFPLFDIHIPFSSDLWLTFYFTLISLARSYVIRRVFNKKEK